MELLLTYSGFLIAAYAVIANDVIQTLGTFIASNHKRHWWVLWAFASGILTLALVYGWYVNTGDVSYGRLANIPFPETMHWWYLLAPITLLIITRLGIPVSTTFMILSVFSSGQLIEKMILKSVLGYLVSFVAALLLYLLIAKKIETKGALKLATWKGNKRFWITAQWGSTAFLWSQWLIQDFANIFVFLPRQLSLVDLLASLVVIWLIMAYIFKSKGGKIQEMVTQKANTRNIRSATIIDLAYGLILFLFGSLSTVPMSTTWAFIGILAGREMAISYLLMDPELKKTYRVIFKDLAKVNIGLAVSILIAYVIGLLNP
jgi:hypothetical protein